MRYFNITILVITIIIYGFFSFFFFKIPDEQQNNLLELFITIDITIIGFLITLVSIIAAIRNIKIVSMFISKNGDRFKNLISLNIVIALLSLILVLLALAVLNMKYGCYILLFNLIVHLFFIIISIINIANIFDMVFEKENNIKNISKDDYFKK